MLGKLFKHEWKASIRVYSLFYILAAIFTIAVMLYDGVFKNFTDGLQSQWLQVFEAVLGMGYLLVLFAVNILTLVYLIYRFYQTMVCDEAYLTHTLPVTTGQLIIVKSIVAFCFEVLSIIVTVLSFLSLLLVSGEGDAIASGFSNMIQGIKESGFWCGNLAITIILITLLLIILFFFAILSYYMCISAGNLFHKHKLLGSIVVYIIFNIIIRVLSVLLIMFGFWTADRRIRNMAGITGHNYMLNDWIDSMQPSKILSFTNSYLLAGLFIVAAGTVILFLISRHLLKNRLNLA